ncbi:MAG: AAA family ATPase [Mycoplasmataceae bacterium]|nr:AAA family ATPase [Mycoplasmataceae bacterium]
MFLKKIVLDGFKSFGNKTEIKIKNSVTGVVGPNGSGKSNIIDAIKWVLGEKSNKQLRGKVNTDVIFKGGKNHKPATSAQVTLYFDNTCKVLYTDCEEISISRKIYQDEGSNEYFINDEPAKLKDINAIFLDSGLNKESLGIVGQGTVQWFIEAKPEERRNIFEEAAGVKSYVAKKKESESQLQNAEINLQRNKDITNELSSEVKKLEKQAEKAKIYNEKIKELSKIELTIFAKDLKYFTQKLNFINGEFTKSNEIIEKYKPDIKNAQEILTLSKKEYDECDKNIDLLSTELINITNELNLLDSKKKSVQLMLENEISSTTDVQKKVDALNAIIVNLKAEKENLEEMVKKITEEVNTYSEIFPKIKEKTAALSEIIGTENIKLAEINSEIRVLENQKRNELDYGVRTIVENSNAINGYCGLVKDFYQVNDKFAKSISILIGKSNINVIVENNFDAQNAVQFLKNNRAGKATFLPLNTLKPKAVKDEFRDILFTLDGYLGIAADLIKYEQKYDIVYRYLLGNAIVCETLENASIIAKYTYQQYRIITIDGDIINPGGSITGGFNQNNVNFSANSIENLRKDYEMHMQVLNETRIEHERFSNEYNQLFNKINERNLLLNQYQNTITTNKQKLDTYEMELSHYSKLASSKNQVNNNFESELENKISVLSLRKDKFNIEINVAKQQKILYRSKIEDQEGKINEMLIQLDKFRNIKNESEKDKIKCENLINNIKEKINATYKLTIDFVLNNYVADLPYSDNEAREIINKLNREIEGLGQINFAAAEALEEKSSRLQMLQTEQEELQSAVSKIREIIREMDNKAKADFENIINSVNQTLPEIFNYLFGGGSAKITLLEPENYLTSGVEVSVNLPGKKITNLNLLSGGEKTLVTISILFAILKNKSFPLVIFDETEAALDVVNVERYGKMIKNYSEKTQFLVITHRNGTMKSCDSLFGITMQNDGVSTVFKIDDFNDVKDFVKK